MREGGEARKFCPRGWRESASFYRRGCISLRGFFCWRSEGQVLVLSSPLPPTAAVSLGGVSVAFFLVPRTGLEARKGLSRPLSWGSPLRAESSSRYTPWDEGLEG